MSKQKTHRADSPSCSLCHSPSSEQWTLPISILRPGLADYIRARYPELRSEGYICLDCLNHIRSEYIVRLVEDDLDIPAFLRRQAN